MRHQQRWWRFKKNGGGFPEAEENISEGEEGQGNAEDPARRKMVCDKCRNHDKLVQKRGHKGSCPYEDCSCDLCTFTFKRQQLMKHQQRVRRSQVAAPVEPAEKTLSLPPTNADSPTSSDVQTLEELSPTGSPWDKCDERKVDGKEGTKSPCPAYPASCHDAQPSEGWTNPMKECTKGNNPTWAPDDSSVSAIPQPPPPPPPPQGHLQEHHKTSPIYTKSDHILSSPPAAECTDSTRVSVRYDCYRPLPQVPTVPSVLTTLSKYGPDMSHPQYLPAGERLCGAGRCMVGANTYNPPQVPLRPQPIPAAHLSRPQMDLQFLGFPYPPASMFQSLPQPSALSMCDNFRLHHPTAALNESFHTARAASHHTEAGGVHTPYTAGLPYFTSALIHPSAKPSLSLMPGSRVLPEYGHPLPVFRQQHQSVHLGAFTRGSSSNVI